MAEVQIGDIVNTAVLRLRRVDRKRAAMATCMYAEGKFSQRSKNRKVTAHTRMAIILQGFPQRLNC